MPSFQSADAQINYQTFGEPSFPALVFSNSLGTNYGMWQKQFNELKDQFFVIYRDHVCHSRSQKIDLLMS